MTSKPTIQVVLTPEQKEQIRKETEKQVQAMKLEALEARLSPGKMLN